MPWRQHARRSALFSFRFPALGDLPKITVQVLCSDENRNQENSRSCGHQNSFRDVDFRPINVIDYLFYSIIDAVFLIERPSCFQRLRVIIVVLECLPLLRHPQTRMSNSFQQPKDANSKSKAIFEAALYLLHRKCYLQTTYTTSLSIPVTNKIDCDNMRGIRVRKYR